MAPTPLRGRRVLDLTNVLAGPFACHQLAHMGADVIKVEARAGGDLARQLGADDGLNRAGMGVSFLAQNPGKRSITLDLKHPDGKQVLRRLVASADVLVENFRPGVMDRLGLGHAELTKDNPKLVYCAISGFGQDGPLRDLPAYDQIIQGMSGMMSITGAPDSAPYRVGYPVADTIGGMTAAFAIAAALADTTRERGIFIDVSMLEAAIATMGWAVSNHLIAGREPQPARQRQRDGEPVGHLRHRRRSAQHRGQQAGAVRGAVPGCRTPRVDCRCALRANAPRRLRHRAELKALIEQAMQSGPADAWWRRLSEAGVPAGPVYSVPQALAHPQVDTRGMIADFRGCARRRPRHPRAAHRLQARRRGPCRARRHRRAWASTPQPCWPSSATPATRSLRWRPGG